jgi:hypothetical protein
VSLTKTMKIGPYIRVTTTYFCGVSDCSETMDSSMYVFVGQVLPNVAPPLGWEWIGRVLLCPKHKIDYVLIDGDKLSA